MTVAGAASSFPDDAVGSAIRERLHETLFVEAGAGTGKTTNLVARIVELVVAGNELRGIAAITFTEAAAAELRDRVRRALVDAALAGRIPAEVAARVDDAMISTLHAFAHRLLAEHPLEAGLPPAIEVLDEIESSLELDERWRAFADELFTRPDLEDVLLRAFALDISVDRLSELASVLHQQRDRLDLTAPPPGPFPPVDAGPVLEALRRAHRLAEHCTSPADKLADHLAELECAEQRLAAATDELELLHLLRWLPKFAKPTLGQAGNWACDVDEVREATEAADHARWSLLGRIKTDVLDRLLHEVSRFVDEAAAARRAEGRLLFHDLLVLARDLLRHRPDVRSRARQRWSHLLIDEFQDTDPLQVELAVLLASDQPPEGDDWPELGLAPGRLFFVGDPKQSIYRFRRADIELFHRVRDHATETPLQLTTNRRSVPGILAWVNAVFGVLLGAGTTATQARYEPLVAARAPLSGGSQVPSVTVLGGAWAEPIDRVRAREAPELAAVIRKVVEEGWTVVGSDGVGRPARFGDVAVLLPTRTGLSHLEDALDAADVPYRVESSTLVWSGQQVRDLLSILRAVDDTTDEVALVAALRSPVLACSDDDLLSFRRAGGRWNLRAPLPEGLHEDHPVARAMVRLRVVHDRRWWTGVSALVDEVARDFGFFELALDQRRPRDHWRRLRFVVEQARAFEATTGATLRRFLDWAALQATDAARVREPVLHEPDDDAVRVLTVHGAKGLEFPVTVLAGLSRERNKGGRPVRVLWDDAGTLQVRLGAAAQTAGYGPVADLDEAREREEQTRLLYVAATRARDHLIVSLHHKDGRDCHARQLLPLCEAHADLIRRPGPPADRPDPPRTVKAAPSPGSPPPADDRLARRRAWEQGRAALVERLGRQPVLAATTVAAGADGDPALRRIRPRSRRGDPGDGPAVGRAVHAVLETVDLGAERGFEDLAAELAAAEGMPDQAEEVTGLVAAALVSDPVRQARRGRHWREVYVAAPVGDAVIEGFVDLLYETDEGLVVIDYKTDLVAEGSIDAAVDRYRLQVAAYAAALEAAVGRPVAAAGLLFLAEGSSQTRFVPDLAGAITEVAARGVILDR